MAKPGDGIQVISRCTAYNLIDAAHSDFNGRKKDRLTRGELDKVLDYAARANTNTRTNMERTTIDQAEHDAFISKNSLPQKVRLFIETVLKRSDCNPPRMFLVRPR